MTGVATRACARPAAGGIQASIILFLALSSCSHFVATVHAEGGGKPPRKQILSFGGNGMIGASVLTKLIEKDEYDITLVSRGSWPFDTDQLIKPHVNFIRCDRGARRECDDDDDDYDSSDDENDCNANAWDNACPELIKAVDNVDEYHAVLDFSGYHKEWIEDAIAHLGDGVRVYVYVSSDSIYEVCFDGGPWYFSNDGTRNKTSEERAVRPVLAPRARRLAEFDEYGHQKLEGEEALKWQRNNPDLEDTEGNAWEGFPYVALRFADIVGPRDNTDRFVTYHVWAKYVGRVEGLPSFHIQNDVVEASSITYVEDAAHAILKAMETPESWDDAYNIASEEIFNVTTILPTLGEILGRDPSVLGIKTLPEVESLAMYPSVTRGPIDVTKAKDELGFQPTPLRKVLEETSAWYDTLFLEDKEAREKMVNEFIGDVLYEDEDEDKKIIERLWEAVNDDVRKAAEGKKTDHDGEEL